MAPLRDPPKKVDRPLKSILKKTSSGSGVLSSSAKDNALFPSSKKDKRRIKHAQLISKVTKTSSNKKPRRRRPNKKLVTTLDALADALPDDDDNDAGAGNAGTAGTRPDQQVNIIKRKSIKSRPGAMKRREKVDSSERDRFAKNMAQLVATTPTDSANSSSPKGSNTSAPLAAPPAANRWAALRGFISQTLETRPQSNPSTT